HRTVRLGPHDRLDPNGNGCGKGACRAIAADDAGEDRAARRLSRFRSRRRDFRADFLCAQQRNLPVQPNPADPLDPSFRRLDAREARSAAQRRICAVVYAARSLRRRVWLGPDLMAIVYDKLMALKIADVEHTYTDKDTMLYALGVGLGHDPLDLKQL